MNTITALLLCALSAQLVLSQGPRDAPQAWPSWHSISCGVCKKATQAIDILLESKPVRSSIKSTVESICNHLPDVFANECDQLIIQYGDNMVDLLTGEMDPNFLCEEINLC